MKTQDFTMAFFEPKSVVIVGASEESGRIGSGLYKSIVKGFSGEIYLVNPKYKSLWNKPCYDSVLDLPVAPSHAIIAVARSLVVPALQQCVSKGIRNVVVISSGFKELDAAGSKLESEMEEICRRNGVNLLGPNTLGFINTSIGYNGTFLPNEFIKGGISIISQSGGVGMALLASLQDQRCGIAKWVGIGNESVLDAVHLLDFLAKDPETTAIAVCFEGLKDLPAFLALAAKVNLTKPIVILRDGKSFVGMQAAVSHTGKMAQPDKVMVSLIRQHGLVEAGSCRECAVMLKALSLAPGTAGKRVAILTNTAGPAILAADILEPAGIALPKPSEQLRRTIVESTGIPMKLDNPADISSNGLSPRIYGAAANGLLESDEYDLLLGFFSLNPHLELPDRQLIEAAQKTKKPVIACFLSSLQEFLEYELIPEEFGIPCYYDPQDAAMAIRTVVQYAASIRSRQAAKSLPVSGMDRAGIAGLIHAWDTGSSVILPERISRQLLRLAGIDNFIPELVNDSDQAAAIAAQIGFPVVMKIHSSLITHKSDSGGVRLNLGNEEAVRLAYQEMVASLSRLDPEARLTLQPMAAEGFEMIIGAVRTEKTGSLVMAGAGGIYSEVFNDAEFRLVPLSQGDALAMVQSLRSSAILDGYRGTRLDIEALTHLIEVMAELMAVFPQIREIDINPCRVFPKGIGILDARIVIEH